MYIFYHLCISAAVEFISDSCWHPQPIRREASQWCFQNSSWWTKHWCVFGNLAHLWLGHLQFGLKLNCCALFQHVNVMVTDADCWRVSWCSVVLKWLMWSPFEIKNYDSGNHLVIWQHSTFLSVLYKCLFTHLSSLQKEYVYFTSIVCHITEVCLCCLCILALEYTVYCSFQFGVYCVRINLLNSVYKQIFRSKCPFVYTEALETRPHIFKRTHEHNQLILHVHTHSNPHWDLLSCFHLSALTCCFRLIPNKQFWVCVCVFSLGICEQGIKPLNLSVSWDHDDCAGVIVSVSIKYNFKVNHFSDSYGKIQDTLMTRGSNYQLCD